MIIIIKKYKDFKKKRYGVSKLNVLKDKEVQICNDLEEWLEKIEVIKSLSILYYEILFAILWILFGHSSIINLYSLGPYEFLKILLSYAFSKVIN